MILFWRDASSATLAGHPIQLSLRPSHLEMMSIRALEGTHQLCKVFKRSTD